ncbi:MAG: hypothetical protein N2487_05850, partial [Verrucomicrobiae bacterium]|nr:hypothetical protein [Verrucomicrobiae bacterium]
MNETPQFLVTLPWAMAEGFAEQEKKPLPKWLGISDPHEGHIGSGGASCRALYIAWLKTGGGADFFTWLNRGRKVVIHGGGLSRRLLSYSAVGKPLMP